MPISAKLPVRSHYKQQRRDKQIHKQARRTLLPLYALHEIIRFQQAHMLPLLLFSHGIPINLCLITSRKLSISSNYGFVLPFFHTRGNKPSSKSDFSVLSVSELCCVPSKVMQRCTIHWHFASKATSHNFSRLDVLLVLLR